MKKLPILILIVTALLVAIIILLPFSPRLVQAVKNRVQTVAQHISGGGPVSPGRSLGELISRDAPAFASSDMVQLPMPTTTVMIPSGDRKAHQPGLHMISLACPWLRETRYSWSGITKAEITITLSIIIQRIIRRRTIQSMPTRQPGRESSHNRLDNAGDSTRQSLPFTSARRYYERL